MKSFFFFLTRIYLNQEKNIRGWRSPKTTGYTLGGHSSIQKLSSTEDKPNLARQCATLLALLEVKIIEQLGSISIFKQKSLMIMPTSEQGKTPPTIRLTTT